MGGELIELRPGEGAMYYPPITTEAQERLHATLARKAELEVIELERSWANRMAENDANHVYSFTGTVNEATVAGCVQRLAVWARRDPGCDITLEIDSYGGHVTDGFHLHDRLLELRRAGHHVTTVGYGMVGSIAGVIFQAGDHRVMNANASMLIHQASAAAWGNLAEIQNRAEFVARLQQRILRVLARRSTLRPKQIERKILEGDWWLTAAEAVAMKFADKVR